MHVILGTAGPFLSVLFTIPELQQLYQGPGGHHHTGYHDTGLMGPLLRPWKKLLMGDPVS